MPFNKQRTMMFRNSINGINSANYFDFSNFSDNMGFNDDTSIAKSIKDRH